MLFNLNKFYRNENNKSILKNKYLIHYSFSPGLYDKLCSVDLLIDNQLNYKLFLFFHEKNMIDFKKSGKSARIFLYQNAKVPFKIRNEISSIFQEELVLKKNYYNDINVFGIMDRNQKYLILNHKSGYFSINLTLNTLNKDLFETKDEIKLLKLTDKIEKWTNKLRDNLMKDYGY
ncbi:hypothetical protein [Chryseobacterium oryctis]|uniref:Uncharacterized protein n=1 Tax=Chryseobacterium oryctis TaxID=2952618 RepID=A0ABT3HQV4_9FLAO|nr:hypothetical protein [Chryseobacterium oryctis]MCW3162176.1 hypothetical protein [Chryseobacterium oryctis]